VTIDLSKGGQDKVRKHYLNNKNDTTVEIGSEI